MKRILIVEDDVVVSSIYRRKYELSGFDVENAHDGMAGLAKCAEFKPDIVQLDLQLPKMSGLEVIKELRAKPEFRSLPILVLSSFYKHDMVKEAWKAGASKCVTKIECTPVLALEIIQRMLAEAGQGGAIAPGVGGDKPAVPAGPAFGQLGAFGPGFAPQPTGYQQTGYPQQAPPAAYPPPPGYPPAAPSGYPQAPYPQPPAAYPPAGYPGQQPGAYPPPNYPPQPNAYPPHAPANYPPSQSSQTSMFVKTPAQAFAPYPPAAAPEPPQAEMGPIFSHPNGSAGIPSLDIRNEFLNRVQEIQTNLRDRANNLIRAKGVASQLPQLREFHEACRTVANLAGTTGFVRVSHLAEALELLLKELHAKPARVTGSSLRTIAHAADALIGLCQEAQDGTEGTPQSGMILAVDDEPISRRVLANALSKANLKTISLDDPHLALKVLNENQFDLIFLDGDMPGMSGFELCKQLRQLPSNKTTPVVFVTSLNDFDSRAQSSLAGGNDLIAKPFLMIELAVKALTYLMKPKTQVPQVKPAGQALNALPTAPGPLGSLQQQRPAPGMGNGAVTLQAPPLPPIPSASHQPPLGSGGHVG